MAGINNLVTKVFVIRVPARDNNRPRASLTGPRNTGLKLPVDSTIESVSPIDERSPLRNTGDLSEPFSADSQLMSFDVLELEPKAPQARNQLFFC